MSTAPPLPPLASARAFGRRIGPGLAACLLVALAAAGLAGLERDVFGVHWLEPLVLAILLGAGVRSAWRPEPRFQAGIDFSAGTLLEVAVVLLGASVSAATLSSLGLTFVVGIFALVALAIPLGFGIGRMLGLNPRMALLVACGNAICGNSAIAAVAPVIGAEGEEIVASIAFTAVLGVIVVLTLPILGRLLSMSEAQYGALAGLTVYAVPQVLAASAPFGVLATQTGTLVKLVRVLTLGPVIMVLSLLYRGRRAKSGSLAVGRLLPWFILGFLVMVALRSLNLIPPALLPVIAAASTVLTVVSMAALGLQTDVRALARASGRAAGAAVLTLVVLALLGLALIRFLGL